ncbi:MAG TPA: hypothetical protein PLE54_09370 [Burkholderiaceae bacterium]|nr:hypothetical protein [Burkholderiaceae bacterium]HQR70802.1 hypothetical protein [Burkholderiaceae bacterium]
MKRIKMADPRPGRVSDLKAGQYADGSPLDDVQYLECKLILKTDEFTSAKGFRKYAKLVAQAAKECGVGFDTSTAKGTRPAVREVMFMDTDDFRLYNNAFILRRRVRFEDGFPAEEPEVVFKFRHPDQQQAAEVDVRPNLPEDYRIKFKAEALPLKDRVGGYRLLYSHNVQFPLSHAPGGDRMAMERLGEIFPALKSLKKGKGDRVSLVNQTIVEEVLQDLGTLDFGKGVTADANIALWRTRGEHLPLVGEFAFQVKFKRRADVHDKARERCAKFFIRLQQIGSAWIYLGATKTGMVYRLKGNPPQAHE